jgi:aldose 1-epimerase
MPTPDAFPSDTEITLESDRFRVRVSPYGASLRGLWRTENGSDWHEVVTPYSSAKGKVGGQGDVLIPFPGRVRDGKYTFEGEQHQMPQNDKDGPNAIHGFVRLKLWDVHAQTSDAITFQTTLTRDEAPGYPFALQIVVTYALNENGLTCTFSITNTGGTPAPVAAGFHPYFTVGSELIDTNLLTLPFAATLEFENLIPTGVVLPVDGTAMDFRQTRTLLDTRFNTCYLQPERDGDGLVRITLSAHDASRKVVVWMDRAFDYVVLYSGDPLPETHRRRSLAIEPMTCASDGFNRPEWGLVTLPPGATFSGNWGVSSGVD